MAVNARRWTARHSSRFAAGGLLIVAATFLPGAESAADTQRTEVSLGYDCAFPLGTQPVTVRVAGEFPELGMVGRPVEPRAVSLEIGLPRPVLDDLADTEAASVSGLADLAVLHTSGKRSATAHWSGLAAPGQDITGRDSVELEASGPVPTATFGSPGTATLSAADLTLTLNPLKADGSPAVPAAIEVPCHLTPGADGTLAMVPISGPASDEPASPGTQPGSDQPSAKPSTGPTTEPGAVDALPRTQREKYDAARRHALAAGDVEPCPFPPLHLNIPADTYVAGYSNVKKLNSAMLLEAAHFNITLMTSYIPDPCTGTFTVLSEGDFDYQGRRQLPPSQGTFLTFGFMPTTATMQLVQVGPPAAIESVSYINDPSMPEYTTVVVYFDLRLSNVKVNGVPLDVGPGCHTATPFKQTLQAYGTGNPPWGYTVNRGGVLQGEAHIPELTGCGVDEDVSRLLTASISGGGNYLKMTQAPLCVLTNPDSPDCPAKKPVPER